MFAWLRGLLSPGKVAPQGSVNCPGIGMEIAACIAGVLTGIPPEDKKAIGSEPGLVELNLLVLFNWIAAWRVSELIPAEFARDILDTMHQPMFECLTGTGLAGKDAEDFVHERYSVYHEIVQTLQGGAAIQRIAAVFVSFCDPNPEKWGVCYSLSMMKTIPAAIAVGACIETIQHRLPGIIGRHS